MALSIATLMASYHQHQKGWEASVYFRSHKIKLWLGSCSKSQAAAVAKHLEELKHCADLGLTPDRRTSQWLENLGPRLKKQIRKYGLIGSTAEIPTEIEAWCQWYIDTRSDWKPSTLSRMKNVKAKLASMFAGRHVYEITAGDAERWARKQRASGAKSHSGKNIASARQYFAAALKERLIAENPFVGINTSQPHDKTRESYVSEETIDKIICAATKEFAAVVACARYGGLRIPSEALSLDWQDVDWEAGRVRVTDTKRGCTREVPLFPKWRAALADWYEIAPEAESVFTSYRSSANKTYRQQLLAVLTRLKIEPWPKLWQNLRASRETDLKRQFPGEHQIVTAWIGNSPRVSVQHYDRIPDDAFERAVK